MSPEVARRKLAAILRYLEDLAPYARVDAQEYAKHHYAVEIILGLLVEAAADALSHLLVEQGAARPDTYRGVFLEAARRMLIPHDLGERLAPFAGLRSVLAHRYAEIDPEKVRAAIAPARETFRAFAKILAKQAGV